MQAATVAANLRSYRYELIDSYELNGSFVTDKTVFDVVQPDRCRTLSTKNGSTIESMHIGKYFYAQQPGTDQYIEYYDDRFDNVACLGDFMFSPGDGLSRLTEATILGHEHLDGHKVVHIRYNYSQDPDAPITGSAAASIPETEVWIEEQTARLLKLMPSIYEPTAFIVYSRFDEPVMPPIEKPAKLALATFTPPPPVPTNSPVFP